MTNAENQIAMLQQENDKFVKEINDMNIEKEFAEAFSAQPNHDQIIGDQNQRIEDLELQLRMKNGAFETVKASEAALKQKLEQKADELPHQKRLFEEGQENSGELSNEEKEDYERRVRMSINDAAQGRKDAKESKELAMNLCPQMDLLRELESIAHIVSSTDDSEEPFQDLFNKPSLQIHTSPPILSTKDAKATYLVKLEGLLDSPAKVQALAGLLHPPEEISGTNNDASVDNTA
ncbi:hypothetical protein BJX99DRAFT_255137 [Aspergillus californicus]